MEDLLHSPLEGLKNSPKGRLAYFSGWDENPDAVKGLIANVQEEEINKPKQNILNHAFKVFNHRPSPCVKARHSSFSEMSKSASTPKKNSTPVPVPLSFLSNLRGLKLDDGVGDKKRLTDFDPSIKRYQSKQERKVDPGKMLSGMQDPFDVEKLEEDLLMESRIYPCNYVGKCLAKYDEDVEQKVKKVEHDRIRKLQEALKEAERKAEEVQVAEVKAYRERVEAIKREAMESERSIIQEIQTLQEQRQVLEELEEQERKAAVNATEKEKRGKVKEKRVQKKLQRRNKSH